jgi:electron transfer flavoprotein beta subunit
MKISIDTAELKADPQTGTPIFEKAPLRISTFDENALEEAIRLREKHGGKVLVLSLVPLDPPREIVLKVLAMGADSVYLVKDKTSLDTDALAAAGLLAKAVKRLESWSLIISGEGSIDQYNAQVGPRIAEALNIPSITYVAKVELKDGKLVAERALEDCIEIVESELPALITVGQEINQPRLPTVLQIMGCSKKPIIEWRVEDISKKTASELSEIASLHIFAPPSTRKKIKIEGETAGEKAGKLAAMLIQEGALK